MTDDSVAISATLAMATVDNLIYFPARSCIVTSKWRTFRLFLSTIVLFLQKLVPSVSKIIWRSCTHQSEEIGMLTLFKFV